MSSYFRARKWQLQCDHASYLQSWLAARRVEGMTDEVEDSYRKYLMRAFFTFVSPQASGLPRLGGSASPNTGRPFLTMY